LRKEIEVKRYKDGTARVRIGRYVEIIEVANLSLYETFDAIRWAAITGGLPINDETAEEMMRVARGLKKEGG
jgi:hypothetical protein